MILLLALALRADPAPTPAPAPRPPPEPEPPAPSTPDGDDALRQKHGLIVGYHLDYIRSKRPSDYHLHGMKIGYAIYIGNAVGFMGALGITIPIGAYQDGEGFNVGRTYDFGFGMDMTFGVGAPVVAHEHFTLYVGGGPHFNGVTLNQRDLLNFNSFTGGLGVLTQATYELPAGLYVGANVQVGVDFVDFINGRDLIIAVPTTIAGTFGGSFGPGSRR